MPAIINFPSSYKWIAVGISVLYYPFLFLVERGNIDGLIFALLVTAALSRNEWLEGCLLGLAVDLKLYAVILICVAIVRGRVRVAGTALVLATIVWAPFLPISGTFVASLNGRSLELGATENLSPALILGTLLKHTAWRVAYLICWVATLTFTVKKQARRAADRTSAIRYFPWMVALPFQVFPYTGVLILAVLMWWVNMLETAKRSRWNVIFILGFLLVGVQQQALNQYFRWMVSSHRLFPFLNALGMVLLLASAMFSEQEQRHTLDEASQKLLVESLARKPTYKLPL